jgi:molecular chaperone HscB
MPENHFERLGLPRRFSIDPQALETAYLQRSRQMHPDHQFPGDDPSVRAAVVSVAAGLNEAYLALKDPIRRAEYWLLLHDGPSAQQEKNLDQLFLFRIMEQQENLEYAIQQRDFHALEAARRAVLLESEQLLRSIHEHLEGANATAPETMASVRKALNANKTLQSLLRRIEFAEEELSAVT